MLNNLPTLPVRNQTYTYKINGYNADIIHIIHASLPEAKQQAMALVPYFVGRNEKETAHNIWKFLRKHCTYVKDGSTQKIKLPARFLHDKHPRTGKPFGDCKTYSLFIVAIMRAAGYKCGFRYASYSFWNTTPSHVYTFTQNLVIDGVYRKFNAEVKYYHKKDFI
jgi:hypothetical protein